MSAITTTWELKLKDLLSGGLQKVQEITDKVAERTDNVGKCFKRLNAIDLQAISQSAQNISQSFEMFNSKFVSYETGMAEVSAITGVTGNALDDLGKKAKASAEQFGGEATDSLNTYKILLSRLGPDIAKSPEALEKMEHNVRILSKTMGNDAVGSVDALTTAMLQYGDDLSNPVKAQEEMTRKMNIMAAGAKEGAAEVPAIAAALKVAGVQAKQSNVSFEETNVVLQALAAGGKEGADAGVALRNVLAKMSGEDVLSKDAIAKLEKMNVNMKIVSDTSLPLTTRLRELKKAQGDATAIAQIFNLENSAAANIMLDSVDAQDKMLSKVTNTTAAQDQANIMMDTQAEKQSRMSALFTNAKIAIGEYTAAFSPYISVGADGISMMANLKNAHEGYKTALSGVKTMLGLTQNATILATAKTAIMSGVNYVATGAQWALNAAMTANPIGLIIAGVVALIALVTVIIVKYDEWGAALTLFLGPLGLVINLVQSFRRHWDSITDAFTKGGIIGGIKRIGLVLLDALLYPMQQLLGLLAKIPGLGGLASGGEKYIKDLRKNLQLTEGDPKEEKVLLKSKVDASNVKLDTTSKGLNLKDLNDTTKNKVKTKGEGTSIGSNDNKVSKSIVMTLNVSNHFEVSKITDVKKLAQDITGHIVDQLRDNVISLG